MYVGEGVGGGVIVSVIVQVPEAVAECERVADFGSYDSERLEDLSFECVELSDTCCVIVSVAVSEADPASCVSETELIGDLVSVGSSESVSVKE